jgi:trk system potassium uptake protein TrkH
MCRVSTAEAPVVPVAAPPAAGGSADRLGAVLAGAVGLCVADASTAVHVTLSPLFTALQCLLFLPWLRNIFDFVAGDRRRGARRLPALVVHLGLAAVAVACLASKWVVLLGSTGALARFEQAYQTYTVIATAAGTLGFVLKGARLGRVLTALNEQPARLMLLSFGTTALLGGFLLTLPVSVRRLEDANFVDGLFMATSAVCVTGLSVHDVARTYTPVGQLLLLLLIQAGGLGIMVLSTFLVIAVGQQMRLRSVAIMAEAIDAEGIAGMRRTVTTIVLVTLGFEALGTLGLAAAFSMHPDVAAGVESEAPLSGAGSILWAALFHSVSAFCNAGFSLFRGNLSALAGDLPVNVVVSVLITAGGLGFPVLSELGRQAAMRLRRERGPRLSLHSRVVLVSSGLLVGSLALLTAVLEWSRSLAHLTWPERLLASLFQSVSARTAGFNSVDLGLMQPATWLIFCAFMFVGASPGSTGGGIKTSTLATLAASLRAQLRGEAQARLFDRALPSAVVQRAIGVAFLSGMLVSGLSFLLLLTDGGEPLRLVFEVVSAFATVGYSTGITPVLTPAGKLIIVVAMLVGRVGPMTLALALAGRQQAAPVRAVEERVLIG